jgi:hypothetical protein
VKGHRSGNLEAEIYASLKLAQAEPLYFSYLKKDERNYINKMIFEMEMLAMNSEKSANGFSSKYKAMLLNFLGFNHVSQTNIFGIENGSAWTRSANFLKTMTVDALYTLGPFLLTLNKLRFMNFEQANDKRLHNVVLNIAEKMSLLEKIMEIDGTSLSEARNSLESKARAIPEKIRNFSTRKSYYWGRILLPWIASVSVFLIYNNTPRDVLQYEVVNQLLPYGHQIYWGKEYLRDITEKTGPLERGKTLVAYSAKMFANIDHKQKPVMALPEFRNWGGQGFDSLRITTMLDLNEVDLSQYDNVVVISHGDVDFLDVGFPTHQVKKLKKDANIIYFACLLGQQGGDSIDSEKWLQFSKSVLNGGKAFAATQRIGILYNPDSAGPSLNRGKEILYEFAMGAFTLFLEGAGGTLAAKILMNASDAALNEYFLMPKGVRIYDSSTDQVIYVPSVENSVE